MLTYTYTARDPASGQKIKAEVQADNEQSAAKLIKQQGLAPLEIEVRITGDSLLGRLRNRVGTKDKVLFSRQLSTLINAGLPLVQSLRSVVEQTGNKAFKVVINAIIADVEGGTALSVAMARHPKVFDQVYISLIAAGEASGTLDRSLERLAAQQEKDAEIMGKVRGAMVYPIIVLLVMAAVVTFMLVTVLPQVEILYEGLGGAAALPLLTQVLLAVSRFVTEFWYVVLGGLAVLGLVGRKWLSTTGGHSLMDRAKMRAWPIGQLFMKLYMARFARTGSTLVACGIPLIQMLEITGKSINNVHVEASLSKAADKVRGGKALSDALSGDPNFLPLVPNMLRIGEHSGALDDMLAKTADYFEKEVDNQIRTISTVIEPVLMIVLGIVALIIVAAVLLPIYGLAGQTFIR